MFAGAGGAWVPIKDFDNAPMRIIMGALSAVTKAVKQALWDNPLGFSIIMGPWYFLDSIADFLWGALSQANVPPEEYPLYQQILISFLFCLTPLVLFGGAMGVQKYGGPTLLPNLEKEDDFNITKRQAIMYLGTGVAFELGYYFPQAVGWIDRVDSQWKQDVLFALFSGFWDSATRVSLNAIVDKKGWLPLPENERPLELSKAGKAIEKTLDVLLGTIPGLVWQFISNRALNSWYEGDTRFLTCLWVGFLVSTVSAKTFQGVDKFMEDVLGTWLKGKYPSNNPTNALTLTQALIGKSEVNVTYAQGVAGVRASESRSEP